MDLADCYAIVRVFCGFWVCQIKMGFTGLAEQLNKQKNPGQPRSETDTKSSIVCAYNCHICTYIKLMSQSSTRNYVTDVY